jgi:hypothetical protein
MIKTSAEYKLAASIAYNGMSKYAKLAATSNVSRNARLAGKVGLGLGGVVGAGLGLGGAGGYTALSEIGKAIDAKDLSLASEFLPKSIIDAGLKLPENPSPAQIVAFTRNMDDLAKLDASDLVNKATLAGIRKNIPLALGAGAGAAGLGGLTTGGLGYLLGAGSTGAYNLIKGKPKSNTTMDILRRALRR